MFRFLWICCFDLVFVVGFGFVGTVAVFSGFWCGVMLAALGLILRISVNLTFCIDILVLRHCCLLVALCLPFLLVCWLVLLGEFTGLVLGCNTDRYFGLVVFVLVLGL